MIYLFPHSGLANRMRVLASGLNFGDKNRQDVTLIWRKDSSLNCAFDDLFQPIPNLIITTYDLRAILLTRTQSRKKIHDLLKRIFSLDFCLFDKDFEKFVWSTPNRMIDYNFIPDKSQNFLFSTCNEFDYSWESLNLLKPIAVLQGKIDCISSEFDDQTIGIHIRRQDHTISIEQSPLSAFIFQMEIILGTNPDTKFFISTDDPTVENTLKSHFGNIILNYEKEFSRTSRKGIQDALIDLYCLSLTSKIYGSYGSSFSDIAARIGNVPLDIIRIK